MDSLLYPLSIVCRYCGSLDKLLIKTMKLNTVFETLNCSRQKKLKEDTYYRLLQIFQNYPEISQRDLARKLGISLGGVNYCLKALIHKGQIKVHNFKKSNRKLGYTYLLTPQGIFEKSRITKQFLERKLLEYEYLKQEIEMLNQEVQKETGYIGEENLAPVKN